MSDLTLSYIATKPPLGWRRYRLSNIAQIQNGYPFESTKFTSDKGYPVVRIRDILYSNTELRYNGEWIASAAISNGDILVGMDGDFNVAQWNGGVALLNQRVCTVRALPGFCNNFLRYYLPQPLKIINDLTYSTTVKHLSSQDVGRIEFYAPSSTEEQKEIVKYLDYKTAIIDKVMLAKNDAHTLLLELRQAMVQNLTLGRGVSIKTKFVNAWVGEIPENWSVTKLSHIAQIKTGGTPSRENLDYWSNGDIPWLASGEVNKEIIMSVDGHITALGMANSNATLLPIGTVVIALNGQGKTKGMAALLKTPATCNQSLAGVICDKKKLLPEYLYYYLKGKYADIRGLKGEARDGLNLEMIGSIPIALPPLDEQRKIVEKIEMKISKIDTTCSRLEISIKLVEEYRSSLISNVVGGRLEL